MLPSRYRREIERLKEQLASAQVSSSAAGSTFVPPSVSQPATSATDFMSPRLVQRLSDAHSSSKHPQSTPAKDTSSQSRSPLAPLDNHLHGDAIHTPKESKRAHQLDSGHHNREGEEAGGGSIQGSANSKHWEQQDDVDLDDSWLEMLGSSNSGAERSKKHHLQGGGLFHEGFRELDGRDLDGRGTPRAQVRKIRLLDYWKEVEIKKPIAHMSLQRAKLTFEPILLLFLNTTSFTNDETCTLHCLTLLHHRHHCHLHLPRSWWWILFLTFRRGL